MAKRRGLGKPVKSRIKGAATNRAKHAVALARGKRSARLAVVVALPKRKRIRSFGVKHALPITHA